ncbi:type II 3-dehydroquinate dehydratase [Curtobacterium sp. VKM Ac-1395]|uniref:type II 3-dehydroquinate dehydratase n=1 Tax=Curtobacterium sp. VKM Ac-1395 TaxID=2783815 RepID=UPI00188AC616|nr:type II 3-dehydroquinate dehydratase [Curtobacterium sp. VKM Ac-1395]MBF4591390.1 type II 3-dehydroquinate dehydratase [Curtobacterium sp. VKM Ac-1395]
MTEQPRILVLNGPNLDILGRRDPEQYGTVTLADVEGIVRAEAEVHGLGVDFRQTNREGELVEWLHEALDDFDGVVINPAAYAHTSVALHDAVEALSVPVVEVHLSNTWKREPFRHVDHVATAATAVIAGAGADGYRLAVAHLASLLR